MLIEEGTRNTMAGREDSTEEMQAPEITEDRQVMQNDPDRRRKVLILICINLTLQIMIRQINQSNRAALVTITTDFMSLLHFIMENGTLEDDSWEDASVEDEIMEG